MIKESNVLKRVKEDALRILGEKKEKVSLKSMKAEINVSLTFMSEAIKTLEEEGLISVEKEFIRLTKNGLAEAKDIVKKHLILENYFKQTRKRR